MKKVLCCVILLFIGASFIGIFFMGANEEENIRDKDLSYGATDITESGSMTGDSLLISAGGSDKGMQGTVRNSSVCGYLMIAEESAVNIYELYENGYREKIKVLDINPQYMRRLDFVSLKEGIRAESYEEICLLIEDFSS